MEHVFKIVENSTIFLEVNDHSVSGETFQLIKNETLDFLETKPQPDANDLPIYYSSEDYISHTNTKRNFFEKTYHIIRRIALNNKLKLINSLHTNERSLLDIGCGTGDFLNVAKQNKWKVVGIEPNESARQIAIKTAGNVVFDNDKLDELPRHSFDVITLWHVLEHLPNLNNTLETIKSLLKPNGALIVAVPNYNSFDAKYYKQYWAAYDVPRHLWHFSQKAIHGLFANKQMKVTKTKPMYFDAFYVALLSEKYKIGRMRFLRAFWVGLKSNISGWRTSEYSSLIYVIENTN